MKDYIEDLGISYLCEGQGKPFVIFHGWGCNKEMFQFMIDTYCDRYKVYCFDLPGFGESKEPEHPFNTEDYCDRMLQVFNRLQIHKPVVMGHSFGGRILIKMAGKVDFEKMILTGSAGVVNPRPLSYYVKIYTYKALKRLYSISFINKMFPELLSKKQASAGSEDYRNASAMMRQVLSIVVNEDLRDEFTNVKVPSLLIWGEDDTATPLRDGQLMEKTFKDAGLVVFEGGTHYAFLEQRNRFITVLNAFV